MTTLVGAIGWGLITVGAFTHLWHHVRLRELLAMHVSNARLAAAVLVLLEAALAGVLAAGVLTDASWLPVPGVVGGALGLAFTGWIARLLLTHSSLPCACSFSAAPTSGWSLLRAAAVIATAGLAWAGDGLPLGDRIAALIVGLAFATALYVLPESLAWPTAAQAQLARLDSHAPTANEAVRP